MRLSFTRLGGTFRLAALAGILALGACSPIMLDDETPVDRRVYANDRAANDSLNAEILRDGVKFVLQPGKPYTVAVTTARTTDVLEVNILQAGGRKSYLKVNALHDGTRQLFALSSTLGQAGFFTARLLTGSNPPSLGAIRHVALESEAGTALDTLRVKLLFIQQLSGLPTDASKATFASAFFGQMNNVLRPYGITVLGITEVVDSDLGPLNFPFSNSYVGLAGARVANHAHLYLVDSISVGNPGTGPVGTVLGFAAREVVDLSDHRESRVILANRATPSRLAITAAHELGHFFGMRHTVSTRHDMLQDDDISNDEDGFTDTRMCFLDQAAFAKRAVPAAQEAGDALENRYCLRIADNACSEPACDLRNLMHPVECDGLTQTILSAQQAAFLKKNMALYRR
jgi:hypothetical protein